MAKNPLSSLAFVDVETTGTSATSDRIIDIGIVRVEDGTIVAEYESLVNPMEYLSPYISSMTSITQEMLLRAPLFEEIKGKVYELLSGATFVAHNAHFDYSFIKSEFSRLETRFNAKMLDTVKLSRLLFPKYRRHNLDAIIERFSIQVGTRHRAFPDAKALYFFLEKAKFSSPADKFDDAIKMLMRRPSLPSTIKASTVKNIPNLPGVYIFYDNAGTVLYVGKSTRLKDRILSHFSSFHSNSTDLRLISTISHIEIKRCGGDLAASLLESELIKKLQPVYNRQLREMREVVAVVKCEDEEYHRLEIKRVKLPLKSNFDKIISIYPSLRRAKDALYEVSKTEKICPRLLGLEKGKGACFNSQIGLCAGACSGAEPPIKHNLKLIGAFKSYLIPKWPFPGTVAVTERSDGLTETTYIDNWMHIGLSRVSQDTEIQYETKENGIYADTVKILKKYLLRKVKPSNVNIVDQISPVSFA